MGASGDVLSRKEAQLKEGELYLLFSFCLTSRLWSRIYLRSNVREESAGGGDETEGGWDQEMAPHVMVNRPTAYKSPGYYRYTTWSNVAMQTIKYTFIHHKYNLYTLKGPMMP